MTTAGYRGLALGFALTVQSAAASLPDLAPDLDRQKVYEYEILREGSPVGHHRVELTRYVDLTRVVSSSLIEIGFLGLTFYRFRYNSEELWDAEGLRRLSIQVDDDGERLDIDGERKHTLFHWSVNGEQGRTHPLPLFPTNHWNSEVRSQTRVLNTLTGGVNQVSIQTDTTLPSGIGSGPITLYRYTGELRLESWYDPGGLWLGMRFEGSDGSTIEYRCRNCDRKAS